MVTVGIVTAPPIQLNTNTNLARKVNICWYAYVILWRSECLWLFQNRRQQKQLTQDVVLQKQQNELESPHMRSHQTTTLASFFSSYNYKLRLITLTSATMNQHSTHLGHRSSTSTVTVWTYTHTQSGDISYGENSKTGHLTLTMPREDFSSTGWDVLW